MKTNFLGSIFLVLFVFGFIGCSDDDNTNDKNRLPETARGFIEHYLPGHQILNIENVDDKGDEMNEKYAVTFSNDVLVSFSSMGYWRRIKSSSELPELLQEVIPFGGAAEVKNTYPIVTINEINVTLYGYQVVTSIGTPIAFYDIDRSNTFGLDLTQETSSWPQKVTVFIPYFDEFRKQFFYFIKEKDSNDSEYRFGDSAGTRVRFDNKGNWYDYEGGNMPLTDLLYEALLPQEMCDVIEQKYKGGANRIYAILRHKNYYQAMFRQAGNQYIPILFDTNTNQETEVPEDAILDFLKTYVGEEPAKDMIISMRMEFDTKQVVLHITGKTNGVDVLNLYTDMAGKMVCFQLKGDRIPDKILTYLPTKVKEYAEKNYAEKEIIFVTNGFGGEYYIQYRDGSRLYFDKEGNVMN